MFILENDAVAFDNVCNIPLFLIVWYLMHHELTDVVFTQSPTPEVLETMHKMNVQLFLLNYVYFLLKEDRALEV